MPKAVPLTGLNRAKRWAAIGALVGIVALVAGVALGVVPQAQWAGRGIYFNVGLIGGALIGGAFVGALAATMLQTARSK